MGKNALYKRMFLSTSARCSVCPSTGDFKLPDKGSRGLKPSGFFIIALLITACLCTAPVGASIHFHNGEFACKCCGKVKVDSRLVAMLERLRAELGDDKIVITSGYRCPKHNKKVGGVVKSKKNKGSQHLYGKAADIKARHYAPAEVGHFARMLGFGYVQVYRSWVHVDVR